MSGFTVEKMRRDADAIFRAAVSAVDAELCMRRFVSLDGQTLLVGEESYDLAAFERVLVVGTGKASPRMGVALEDILGDHVAAGLINTKYGHAEPLTRIRTAECGHPVPDQAGVAGTDEILDLLDDTSDQDLVICLISGGGSALMPAPSEGISLEEKQETTRLLLGCGANIVELNAIRKHLSRVKGGGLARAASPARVATLMLSDVIGDPMDAIASGPTVPDPSTFKDCCEILARYGIADDVPQTVRDRFRAGEAGEIPETPKPGDEELARCQNLVVGSNGLAVEAAREKADGLGYNTLVLSTRVEGEAREVVNVYTAIAKEILTSKTSLRPPACVIAGGETTVLVRGEGKGGRNQELVLAGAMQLSGWDNVVLFSGGTDGTDGPTDAAGAVADGDTLARAEALGLSADAFLKDNDSYAFFEPLRDLVITGPTGTNVADVALVLVGGADSQAGL
ncbi:MAG: glycerate kinase [Candidatus Latescibacteria bacterium]|jgi:hydroxypyruvate reductase|nr:glycerate kinase [Candidatus Latescibacterota bacterium]